MEKSSFFVGSETQVPVDILPRGGINLSGGLRKGGEAVDGVYVDMEQTERAVCAVICRNNGLRAREIARALGMDRSAVNRVLYSSALLRELCWQDGDYRWHGIVRQARPHSGLSEFAGYYSTVREFLALDGEQWLSALRRGCENIGRSLSDRRGLIHSFRDCREQLMGLFADLGEMLGPEVLDWELKRSGKSSRG